MDIEPDWVHLDMTPEGFPITSYFTEHPEMILGELTSESTQYGKEECTVVPDSGQGTFRAASGGGRASARKISGARACEQ